MHLNKKGKRSTKSVKKEYGKKKGKRASRATPPGVKYRLI